MEDDNGNKNIFILKETNIGLSYECEDEKLKSIIDKIGNIFSKCIR